MADGTEQRKDHDPGAALKARAPIRGLLIGILSVLRPAWADPGPEAIYKNPSRSVDDRVNDLVSRLTLEEKAAQLQFLSPAIPRLGIPGYNWWNEGIHGIGFTHDATSFPQAIGLAASFDRALLGDIAAAIAIEARARYGKAVNAGSVGFGEGLTFWAPNVNIFRDPRWGRGQETYGEDPFLTSELAVAYIRGLQGDSPQYERAIATPKHFAVHSGPETGRHQRDVTVSRHDLEDTYLPAFRAAVVDGKAGSIMCAYNSVNGEPACANGFLLEQTLRSNWHFDGYVVSDCGAIQDIWKNHKDAASITDAVALSLNRGTDLDCDFLNSDLSAYIEAVKSGKTSEANMTAAVKRLFRARIRLGMFDPSQMTNELNIPTSKIGSEQPGSIALQAARESMVLLKNDGVLPLTNNIRKIAVVGPLADSEAALLGNYFGTPSTSVTVLEGLRRQFPAARIAFAPGTDFLRIPFAVPEKAFSSSGKTGLTATYYANKDLSGEPVATRIDTQPMVGSFGMRTLPAAVSGKDYSVRWTGALTAPESGSYTLALRGAGGVRLWLGGQLFLDDWREQAMSTNPLAPPERKVDVKLEAGRAYELRIEEFRSAPPASLSAVVTSFSHQFEMGWVMHSNEEVDSVVTAANDADIVVAVVGITAQVENEEGMSPATTLLPGFNNGDRTTLDLPQSEEGVLRAVKGLGKPLVVVLMNGGAMSANWASQHADAILEAWYPGQAGGTAVAETLAGLNNPAGRLPVTFYRSVDDLPPFDDYAMKSRTYRYFQGPVLYPFGFGLSYSKFSYGKPRLSAKRLAAGQPVRIDIDIRNLSKIDGHEVPQVYVSFPDKPGAPIRALRAFERISVAAGGTRHVSFVLKARDLSFVNELGEHVISAGTYRVRVGGDSGAPVSQFSSDAEFTVSGQQKLPD
jgi:beta-glucosidase